MTKLTRTLLRSRSSDRRRTGVAALVSLGVATLAGSALAPLGSSGLVAVVSRRTSTTGPVIATVRVGRYPFDLAVDGRRGHVFVVNADKGGSGSVSMLDATTGRLLRTVPVGFVGGFIGFTLGVQEVVVDSQAGRVFVTRLGRTVLLDAASGRVLRVLGIGVGPGGLAVDERSGRAFMDTADGVSVLDGATGRVLRTIPGVGALAFDGRAGRLVVADLTALSVVDVGTGRLVGRTPLDGYGGQRACWLAADSVAGRAVLAVDRHDPQEAGLQPEAEEAWVLDTRSGRIVRRTVLDEWQPLSCDIPTVAVDPVRGRAAVVTCTDPRFLGVQACLVTLLDTRSGRALHGVRVGSVVPPNNDNIPPSSVYAGPVAVDTRRGLTFVTTLDTSERPAPSTVVALDTETGRVRAQIGVGRFATSLAVDEQRGRLFVANEADGTVSVIDTTRL